MRILHVITGLRRAGAETMLVKLVGALARQGFENRVVCLIERGPLAAELEGGGTPVTSLGMRSGFALGAVLHLVAAIRRFQPEIIQTWLYHADLAGLVATMLSGYRKRLIWNIRCSDMDFDAEASAATGRVVRLLARLSALPAGVIVNSHSGRLHHERLGYRPRWWIEIPNGFEIDRWDPDPDAAPRLRAELALPADALIVGMCARVAPMKDHASFFAAIAQLRARSPRLHAVLAGRGTESLGAMVGEFGLDACVSLLGERNDLPALVPGFDVFCLSSAFGEGFANVLGEAMACGVPCVATDVGDAAEIIGDTGLIVPPRRPDALAAALGYFAEMSAERRGEFGARARARLEERYSLSQVARRYVAVYSAVTSGVTPK
jgi:glycosyltransferase involved in cell wall biosynthesis